MSSHHCNEKRVNHQRREALVLKIDSVSEGVNEVIDAELVSGICVLSWVPLVVSVFPAISHVRVPVDQDHDPAIVVHDRMI